MTLEDDAIEWVKAREADHGRTAKDVRREPGSLADIISSDQLGNKCFIEIKAASKTSRGNIVWLERRQYEAALRNPDYYVYIVDKANDGAAEPFNVKVIGGELLQQLLEKAQQKIHYEMPFPTSAYDAAPHE